jgi:F-type H+-transporting ATPase subunit a
MQHITGEILGKTVHIDTLYFTWSCMGLILISALALGSGLSAETQKYGIRQHIAESIFNFIRWLTTNNIGKRGDKYIFFIGSIFIFILVNYYAGLLPWKMGSLFEWWPQIPAHGEHGGHGHPWHGASPCADINITAGMAVLVIITYFMSGTFVAGFKYIQMFLPINITKYGIKLNLMCLIEIMDLAVRPLTLSLRLFANTLAGETLLASFISMVALVLPVAILGFEMAVGVLQSFIFTILTAVYIGSAVQHAEHLLHDEHH